MYFGLMPISKLGRDGYLKALPSELMSVAREQVFIDYV